MKGRQLFLDMVGHSLPQWNTLLCPWSFFSFGLRTVPGGQVSFSLRSRWWVWCPDLEALLYCALGASCSFPSLGPDPVDLLESESLCVTGSTSACSCLPLLLSLNLPLPCLHWHWVWTWFPACQTQDMCSDPALPPHPLHPRPLTLPLIGSFILDSYGYSCVTWALTSPSKGGAAQKLRQNLLTRNENVMVLNSLLYFKTLDNFIKDVK